MSDLIDLTGKTVLITGGAGAIGRVVVRVLAEHGANVAVNDLLPEAQVVQALTESDATGSGVVYFQADATDVAAVETLFDRVEERQVVMEVESFLKEP